MLFSSIPFIFYFFPAVLALYLASGLKTAVLLTASVLFYSWGEGIYVLLLGTLVVLNFVVARSIQKRSGARRKTLLIGVLICDLGVLGLFKYTDFAISNLNILFPSWHLKTPGLALPLGISFFSFQLISYIVDVYRQRTRAEPNLMRFATYVLMFPHLIAGPIVRYAEIHDELRSRRFDLEKIGLGIQYFIVGLCQKVLIANTLAPVADHAFDMPVTGLSGATAWLGMTAYTLQIYFDFCGYSNMAIGLAFMLGFTFPRNFDYPYSARSITDFWRRWHMSLSFWFRDYVYIPLGGSRGSRLATFRNLLLVFFLTGLWHGAAWNFVVWGLFHGAFLLIERMGLGHRLARRSAVARSLYVMLIVMVGWVFFRAPDLTHALEYLKTLLSPGQWQLDDVEGRLLLTPEVLAAFTIGALLSWPALPTLFDRLKSVRVGRTPWIAEARLDTVSVHRLPVVLLLAGFTLSTALLLGSTLNPFLYFRF